MKERVVGAAVLAVLAPVAALAVPVSRELRPHPRTTAAEPSYISRVEPALLGLRVKADREALSSVRLGAERFATAVTFDGRGYAVTVSYALLDAVQVEAKTRDGRTVRARVAGLDLESGLGVVKLEGPGPWPAARLGQSRDVVEGTLTGTVGLDEDNDLVYVTGAVQRIRRFAGFWEYMLDRAFIVAPSTEAWGGSAVVDAAGSVVGIASLRVGAPPHVNVVIPIDRLTAVQDELIAAGRVMSRPPRPWLGLYTRDGDGAPVVDGFSPAGPAARAGFRPGDQIVGVNGVVVRSQEEFYEQLWRNRAGDVIQVAVRRSDGVKVIAVPSVDRYRTLRQPR
ncbi:MAG: serine protease [Candidatus Rokubacteria bacterium]|nr:serine protease [Candidatus Rokubacteria bacterium]MBI3826409.1 serine protease [Candidatus Rokubacteria bacterium]